MFMRRRKFVQVRHNTFINQGELGSSVIAVADDGTAWIRTSGEGDEGWVQIKDLPDREDSTTRPLPPL